MTRKLAFVATEILLADRDGLSLEHNYTHDLESFAWIVIYVIYERYVPRDTAKFRTTWPHHEELIEEMDTLFGAQDLRSLILQRRYNGFERTISTAGGIHYLVEYLGHLEKTERTPTANASVAVMALWHILRNLQPVKKDIPPSKIDKSDRWQKMKEGMRQAGIGMRVQDKGPSDGKTDGEGIDPGERRPNITKWIKAALECLME
ncbi:hypothetical protein C8Q79DRAFT_327315 [Trametes meyenii]|nr:hypothetical protein C8Q79DRAFT_327315 [Trametes meyenii]